MLYSEFDEGTVEYNYQKFYPSSESSESSEEEKVLKENERASNHPLKWHIDELKKHFHPVTANSHSRPVIQPQFVETFFNTTGYTFPENFINLAAFLELDVSVESFANAVKNQNGDAYAGATDLTVLLDTQGKHETAAQLRWYNLAKNCYHYIDDTVFKIFKLCNKQLKNDIWDKSPFYGLKVWQIRQILDGLDKEVNEVKKLVSDMRVSKPKS